MRPSLVIFDCDGVLVDSETASNQVIADNLTRHGLQVDLADCLQLFVGGTIAGVRDKARSLGAELDDDWIDEIYGEINARLRQGVPVVAGIPKLLETLCQSGVPFCVASNGGISKMQITLGYNDLWDTFANRVFSAHVLGVAKPDPGLFLAAADHFEIPATTCLVIEDSATGARAASRAGMRCLGYAAHDDGAKLRAEGAEVFTDMDQVAGLISL